MNNSEETFKFRNDRCSDCGFTEGTEANGHGLTAIKAKLCAEAPTPFFCHFNAVTPNGQLELKDGTEVLCQGWVEECNKLEVEGFYDTQPKWKRKLSLAMTDIISEIERVEHGSRDPMEYFHSRLKDEMDRLGSVAK